MRNKKKLLWGSKKSCDVIIINECKRGYARSGTYFCHQKVENRPKKRCPFKGAWKLSVVHPKEADQIISREFRPIISTFSKWLKVDTWRRDVFFSVGEAATSKWTHGEVAVFGSTVYKIFAFKCQKLGTPLASLAPCVIRINYRTCWAQQKINDGITRPPARDRKSGKSEILVG